LIIIGVFENFFLPLIIVGLLVYVFGIKDAYDSAEKINDSSGRFFRQDKTILLFVLIMLGLQSIPYSKFIKENFVEAFKMPSGSMLPTMTIGDHFLIGKSRPFFTSLQRGDIVVFPFPEDPSKKFVKRVIGLGGDKLQIINGELYINDTQVASRPLGVEPQNESPSLKGYGPHALYEERNGDAVYRVQYLRDRSTVNGGPWLVPQDAVFVMGDNRDNSQDSRVWGPVQSSTIKGKALKIYWSWDRGARKVRWERIGEIIR
jgi:signal peptidase I